MMDVANRGCQTEVSHQPSDAGGVPIVPAFALAFSGIRVKTKLQSSIDYTSNRGLPKHLENTSKVIEQINMNISSLHWSISLPVP